MVDNYSNYGIEVGNKITGEVVCVCPKCSHDRKPKNQKVKCLGVNLDKKVWRCNHCGWAGALRLEREEKKIYQKPIWKNNTLLSDRIVKWFESRCIRQKTLNDAAISEGKEWMPQTQKEENTIQFNYFKGEELINVKYRTGKKDFKLFKDAELIFYNLKGLDISDEIYIVEGEIDCLSFIESGILNVLSVPNGANVNTNRFDYLDSCIDKFNGKKIHLALDNDIAGRKLRDELSDRFGKDRCDFIEFKESKDANDCLVKFGIQGILDAISVPKQFPLEGVFTISDFNNEIEDLYEFGLDKGYDLQIPNFDLRIVKGYFTTITGVPGSGKSEWVDNMALSLRIHHNCKGAFYSPENKPTELHFSKLARKLIGKHWEGKFRISHEEKNLVKRYLDNYFFFLKPEKDFTLTTILSQVKMLQQRHGLDFFVIDAWNKLEHKGKQDTDYVGRCLDELAMFCETQRIHLFLVAHPRKMPKDDNKKYEVPTMYDIAGSSNFYNKTDNGLSVVRDKETGISSIYRQKIKFDHWGVEGFSDYYFDRQTLRYDVSQNFDKSNWITYGMAGIDIKQISVITENTDFLNEKKVYNDNLMGDEQTIYL